MVSGKRRKRSNVPYFCDDLVFELDKIKTYLEDGNRTGQVSVGMQHAVIVSAKLSL